jgi:hypothetical protein
MGWSKDWRLEMCGAPRGNIIWNCGIFTSLPRARKPTRGSTQCRSVNDLGGQAFESWTNNTGKMWLEDFLPHDVKGIRIMTHGYNSSLSDKMIEIDFLDHRRDLLQNFANARRSALVCILLDKV